MVSVTKYILNQQDFPTLNIGEGSCLNSLKNYIMVHLVYNADNEVIGWEMRPTTPEEQKIAGAIRDMQFFGIEDTYPAYNGLELINPNKGKTMGNIKRLSWVMRKYQNK